MRETKSDEGVMEKTRTVLKGSCTILFLFLKPLKQQNTNKSVVQLNIYVHDTG